MAIEPELHRRLHELAESAGPWPDPLDSPMIFNTPRHRRLWLPVGTVAAIVVLMAVVIGTVLFLKPAGRDAEPAVRTPATTTPVPVGCGTVPVSTGPAAKRLALSISATPTVVPGQSIIVQTTESLITYGPTYYLDTQPQLLIVSGGLVLGELQTDPVFEPPAGVSEFGGINRSPSESYGSSYLGGGGRYQTVALPGCPSASTTGKTLPPGNYQVVAVLGYAQSAGPSADEGDIVSAAASVTVTPPGAGYQATASIAGELRENGGPAPGHSVRVAGEISAFTNPNATGTPVATTHTDASGRFVLELPPGTYYLTGSPDGNQVCVGSGAVQAKAGSTSTDLVGCPIP